MSEFQMRPALEIASELREQAEEAFELIKPEFADFPPDLAEKLGLPILVAGALTIEDTLEWEAAELIEAMHRAMIKIFEGGGDPREITAPFVEN